MLQILQNTDSFTGLAREKQQKEKTKNVGGNSYDENLFSQLRTPHFPTQKNKWRPLTDYSSEISSVTQDYSANQE